MIENATGREPEGTPADQAVPAVVVNVFVVRGSKDLVRVAFGEGVKDVNATYRVAIAMNKSDARDMANAVLKTLDQLEQK